ncbi:hypothetical protein JCM5350_004538 [Sporobolomyces pararoseus]
MSYNPSPTPLGSLSSSKDHRPSSSLLPRDALPPSLDPVKPEYDLEPISVPSSDYLEPQSQAQGIPFPFSQNLHSPLTFLSSFQPRQFDSNSYEDVQTGYYGSEQDYEAGTPSYCGSWTSDLSESASPSRYSNLDSTSYQQNFIRPSPSFENLYQQAAIKTEQLSLDMPPFDSTTFEEPLSISGENEGLGEQGNDGKDRDMTLTIPRAQQQGLAVSSANGTGAANGGGAGGGSTTTAQRPFAYTRNSSGFTSFLNNYANTPTTERARPATPAYSATRSTVFDVPVSATVGDSPSVAPVDSVDSFSPSVATTSPNSTNGPSKLPKLEIPNGPNVPLSGFAQETAKPRPKGRGTLELERVLGLWAAKTPTSSFPNLPSLNPSSPSTSISSSTQPLFAQSIVSSEPESFVTNPSTSSAPSNGNTSIESNSNNPFPSFGGGGSRDRSDSLAVPAFFPRRRRSKSDTDIMRGDSLGFPHSNLPVGPYVDPPPVVTSGPTFSSTVAPPTPVDGPMSRSQQFAMNPNETWRSPPPPSSYTTNPVTALDLNTSTQQHELVSRSRPSLLNRNHGQAGGPGYHEAALLDVPGDGGRSRRSRSQGAGHRPSRSDDFSHFLPTLQQSTSQPLVATSADGLLAPPQPQAPPGPQAPSPVPSAGSPLPSQAGSPYQQTQSLPQPPAQSLPTYPATQYTSNAPHYPPSTSQHPVYPPAPPDQGYLANQAALLASAALIAFNPTDPAHAAAAAAGYLPPPYPQFPSHSYNIPYGSPYGAPPPGLPTLPAHHQIPSQLPPYHPRPSNGLSHVTRASLVNSRDPSPGGSRPPHPAYTYHSPLSQLPSPPSTSKSHSPAATGSGTRTSTRGGRGRRAAAKAVETEEEGDEDESMMMDEDEVPEEDEQGGGEEDGDEEDGKSSTAAPAKGKGKKGKGATTAKSGRGKRQVSEEGFSEKSKTTQATIDAAKRRRNANAVAKFVCDLCGETFTRRYNLRGHQRAHNGEKPYKCSYEGCDKAFARAHDCKRHELLHLGVRKYHCSPCKRDFVRLDALHRHHRSEVGQACVKQLEAEGYVFDEKGAAVTL